MRERGWGSVPGRPGAAGLCAVSAAPPFAAAAAAPGMSSNCTSTTAVAVAPLSASKTKTKKKHFVCQKVKLFRASEPILSVLMWGVNHTVTSSPARAPPSAAPRAPTPPRRPGPRPAGPAGDARSPLPSHLHAHPTLARRPGRVCTPRAPREAWRLRRW